MSRPSVFIGSSTEGLEFARAIRTKLESSVEIILWEDDFFTLGSTFIESLVSSVGHFDFAILVLTGDDLISSRNQEKFAPRDNVIFELGLFMGTLGRERCFIVQDKNIKMPTDLAGVTTASYDWPRKDNNYAGAVGSACDAIRKRIISLGVNERKTQKKLEVVEAEQSSQKKSIDALSFLISHFVPQYEIDHLKNLLSKDKFEYQLQESFKREIRHLLDMQFIRRKPNVSFSNLPEKGNLKDYFEVTDLGKNLLRIRSEFEQSDM